VQSLWWNPAAIARGGGTEAYVGIAGIWPGSDVSDRGSTITFPVPPAGLTVPVGGNPHAEDPIFKGPVPNLGYASPVGDRFAVGVFVAAPFNFTTKYDSDSFARYEALKSRLTTVDIGFTGAYRVNDWLDFGVGIDAIYTSARIGNAVPNLPNPSPPPAFFPDGRQDLSGQSWDMGWNVGLQAHPNDRLTVGAAYRSAVERDVRGFAEVSGLLGPLAAGNGVAPAHATFTTPWTATFGARYRLGDKLHLNGQIVWLGWDQFDAIVVHTPVGRTVLAQNYENTLTEAIGVDYDLNHRWTLRGGVQHDPTPTPDGSRDLRVPDSDRWLFNGGASYRAGSRLTIDGAVGYVRFNGSDVDSTRVFFGGTPAQTTVHQLADVEGHAWVVSTGAHWVF
jgi:long-chain fatty acid transport protein